MNRGHSTASLLAAGLLLLAGCATEYADPQGLGRAPAAGNTAADRRVVPISDRDRVLVDYRLAATALRQSDHALAKEKLDDAIAQIGGIVTNSESAARARSLFAAESTKIFIGEPYERTMAYYYRGILYWREWEPDNARS